METGLKSEVSEVSRMILCLISDFVVEDGGKKETKDGARSKAGGDGIVDKDDSGLGGDGHVLVGSGR